MKIKVRGVLCPACGQYATIYARNQEFDQWIGYAHAAQCPDRQCWWQWLILFDDKNRFKGIIREQDMMGLGGVRSSGSFRATCFRILALILTTTERPS